MPITIIEKSEPTREQIIKELLHIAENSRSKGEVCRATAEMLVSDKSEIERMRDERRWIPIAKRMPDISDGKPINSMVHVVLCYFADGNVDVFDIDDIDRWNDGNLKYKITHWQKLPQPPEESEEVK